MTIERDNIPTSLRGMLTDAASGDLSKIPGLLEALTINLDVLEEEIAIKNKSLENANREQPELYLKYSLIHQRLKAVSKMIDAKIENKKAQKYKSFKSTSNIPLNTTDLNQWVNGDAEIHGMYVILMLVDDFVYQYDSIVKAFEMRGYSLKNVTESRIHAINSLIIS